MGSAHSSSCNTLNCRLPTMGKAMKAMKAAGASGMTASGAFAKVAEKTELKPKQVKAVITSYCELAASELKKNGKFKLGGVLNMKLKKKPAKAARKGVNPFTKESRLQGQAS